MAREALARRITRRLVAGGTLANALGAAVVFIYLSAVFPVQDRPGSISTDELNLAVLVVLFAIACAVGFWRSRRLTADLRAWAHSDRPAGEGESRLVLGLPGQIVRLTAQGWGVAIPVFGVINADSGVQAAVEVAGAILLGGLVTCTAAWLVAERELRPAVALVLDSSPPPEAGALGVEPRIVLTWALCSGIPLIALAFVPIGRLPDEPSALAAPIVFIAVVALATGLALMRIVARSVAGPVREVQRGMEAVAAGRTDVRVTVDDGSEVGRLQAGFNAMVEGLAEREYLRDLFGRQVGLDVARDALERGITLGGEERTVGSLFVDVLGSTALAVSEPPERVVGQLNAFFAIVVAVVERHGGFVNKFEGDGALCVFGAPAPCEDAAQRALAAARDLAARLEAESPLPAAIGVSCGQAVAGHVGAESRFEYTVIGDPVNEAARITELAKTRPGHVLASAHTVRAAGEPEAAHWRPAGEAVLRGRPEPTELAAPG